MIQYRPMEEKDLEQVMDLENRCFSQAWSKAAMLRELRENSEMAHYMVAESEGRIVAYGGYWQIFDEAHITNIAVAPDYRRRGIGGELIRQMESQYPSKGILYACLLYTSRGHRMYKKVSTDLNFVGREEEVLQFWKDRDIFRKSVEMRKEAPSYTFYDGPPTANGRPHIGHVLTLSLIHI